MSLVSVVLPAFNAERFLADAIESVRAQTLQDIEIIVVDDGSTDGTREVIAAHPDPRIKLIRFDSNRGLVSALTEGIDAATSDLIARLDADDVAHPDRLRRQAACFSTDARLGLLGSWCWRLAGQDIASGGVVEVPGAVDHAAIRLGLHLGNQFNHSSTMFRRASWRAAGGYRADEWPVEDFGLWLRISAIATVANIPEPLVSARSIGEGISSSNREVQAQAAQRVAVEAMEALLGHAVAPEVIDHLLFRTFPTRGALIESREVLFEAMHRVAQECDARQISRRGLRAATAALLRYRADDGQLSLAPLLACFLREPAVAARFVGAGLRSLSKR